MVSIGNTLGAAATGLALSGAAMADDQPVDMAQDLSSALNPPAQTQVLGGEELKALQGPTAAELTGRVQVSGGDDSRQIADGTKVVYSKSTVEQNIRTLESLGILNRAQANSFRNAPLEKRGYAAQRLLFHYNDMIERTNGNIGVSVGFVKDYRLSAAMEYIASRA